MNEIKYYRVHVGFIDSNGVVIKPGVYSENEVNVAEASRRSYITPELNYSLEAKDVKADSVAQVEVKSNSSTTASTDIKDISLEVEPEQNSPTQVQINYITKTAIVDLKYIGHKTAEKVVSERSKSPFVSYADLDERVPLSGNRKWETVGYLGFESADDTNKVSKASYEITDTASNASK